MSNKTIEIALPPQLRQFNQDKDTLEILPQPQPHTLRDALCALPLEAQRRVFQTDLEDPNINTSSVRRTVLVFLNDEDHRFLDLGLDHCIAPGDRISVVPALAGG